MSQPLRPLKLVSSAIAAVAMVGVLIASAQSSSGIAADGRDDSVRLVQLAPVIEAPATVARVLYGNTRSRDRAALSFTLPGRVATLPVKVGDEVTAGQTLAELDAEPLRNQIRAADAQLSEIEAQIAQLQRDDGRARRLLDAEIGTAQTIEQIESGRERLQAGREAADAQRAEARRMIRETTLTAPYAGTVAEVMINAGQVVGAGMPIVILTGSSGLEIEIEVPESVFAQIHDGQEVQITFPMSGGAVAKATVTNISRSSAYPGRLFPVVVALADTVARIGETEIRVVPGMAAAVTFDVPRTARVAVPIGAIVDPTGTETGVFVVEGGTTATAQVARRVPVTVDSIEGQYAFVRGALEIGAQVVISGHGGLQNAESVEVAR